MYDESMLFVGPAEGECTAPLLFPATQPLSLRAATHEFAFEEGRDFARNVSGIIEAVRATSPLAEFVVVSPMLPIAEPDDHALVRFPAYRDALLALCDDGVVLADLTTLWTDLLGRKRGYDLTGNGLNHPNDFGHRLYAQVILSLLVAHDR